MAVAIIVGAFLVQYVAAQDWTLPLQEVDDMPHNLLNNEFTMIPRQPRSSKMPRDDDVKESFFRNLRAPYEELETYEPLSPRDDLPKPGGFLLYYNSRNSDPNDQDPKENRAKRYVKYKVLPSVGLKSHFQIDSGPPNNKDIRNKRGVEEYSESENQEELELEAAPFDADIIKFDEVSPVPEETRIIKINDFIRFKRDASVKPAPKSNQGLPQNTAPHNEYLELESENQQTKRSVSNKTGRMLMEPENSAQQEGFREARGATKEQWIKQPYPVHDRNVDENRYDDNTPSSSDSVRAPRVHFVTQRRLETAPSLSHPNYDRESRARELNREPQRDNSRDYYSSRPSKHFDVYQPPPSYSPHRYDPYEEPRYRQYNQRYDPPGKYSEYERARPEYSTTRQRRIIYYTTLPEVVRTPPNVDLRDRYNFRDRYDDRYIASPPLSVAGGGNYSQRKPYPYTKSRYEQEIERTKAPYPLKVSTDVNIRETKKNPERRIYSEADRRYGYKAPPYQSEESFDRRA